MLSSPQQDFNREDQMARFAVHSRTEILFLLRAIQKRKLLVNLDLRDPPTAILCPPADHPQLSQLLALTPEDLPDDPHVPRGRPLPVVRGV